MHPRTHPSPTRGPARSSPSSRQRSWNSLLDHLSNELTSPVMSVTQWPKLTRALPQTFLVESGTRGTQVPSVSQRDHHEVCRVTQYTVQSSPFPSATGDRRQDDLCLRVGPGPGVAEYGGSCPQGSPYSISIVLPG